MTPPEKYTPVLCYIASFGWLLRYSAGEFAKDGKSLLCYERQDDERFPNAFERWRPVTVNADH